MTTELEEQPLVRLNPQAAFPHYPPAEKSVISCLIKEPSLLDEVPLLTIEHFMTAGCASAFSAIRRICEDGIPEGELFGDLRHQLYQRAELDRVGGDHGLADLYTYAPPTLRNIQKNAEILNHYLARRKAIKAGLNLIEEAFTCGDETERVLAAAADPITEIHEIVASSRPPKTRKEVVTDRLEAFERRCLGRESAVGIPTIAEIDAKLYGLHPGRVWVIGGYPEGGKSALAGQILTDIAVDGTATGFISLEMGEGDLIDRAFIMASRVDAKAFTKPIAYAKENDMQGLSKGILQAIKRGIQAVAEAPFHVVAPSNDSLPAVLACIRRLVRDHGVKVVAVDYIQRIKPSRQYRSEEEGIKEISNAIQAVSKEMGISILLLSQLNESGDTARGRVIEQDADALLYIIQDRNKNSPTYKQHLHILIGKDRHYGSGGQKINLVLDRSVVRFKPGSITAAEGNDAGF
jgi:replicative DNA helicase